jgi:hypothetical protein
MISKEKLMNLTAKYVGFSLKLNIQPGGMG